VCGNSVTFRYAKARCKKCDYYYYYHHYYYSYHYYYYYYYYDYHTQI